MNIQKFTGQKIKILRKQLALSQIELATLAGISVQRLKKIELGENNISICLLFKITEILGTKPSEFYKDYFF